MGREFIGGYGPITDGEHAACLAALAQFCNATVLLSQHSGNGYRSRGQRCRVLEAEFVAEEGKCDFTLQIQSWSDARELPIFNLRITLSLSDVHGLHRRTSIDFSVPEGSTRYVFVFPTQFNGAALP